MNLPSHAISLVFISGFRFTRGTDPHASIDPKPEPIDRAQKLRAGVSPSKRDTEKQIDGTNRPAPDHWLP